MNSIAFFGPANQRFQFRYGRDYYINDSRTASGSRKTRTVGDLRNICIDNDDANAADDDDDDSVSDLELYNNHKRDHYNKKSSRVIKKSSTLDLCTEKYFPHLDNNNNNNNLCRRSMSVCSLSSGEHEPSSSTLKNENVSQFEKFALYNDVRRYSFRCSNGTSHFVINPLFNDNGDGSLMQ